MHKITKETQFNTEDYQEYRKLVIEIMYTAISDANIRGKKLISSPVERAAKLDGIKFFFDGRFDFWAKLIDLKINFYEAKKAIAKKYNIDPNNPSVRIKEIEKYFRDKYEK